MNKSNITKTWLISLGGVLGGLLVAGVGTALLFAFGGTAEWGGPQGNDLVGFGQGAFFWPAIAIIVGGGIVAALGGVVQLVAWVLALVLTAQTQLWVWFVMLLLTGLLGFQLIGMIVYVVAAPEHGPAGLPYPIAGPRVAGGGRAPSAG